MTTRPWLLALALTLVSASAAAQLDTGCTGESGGTGADSSTIKMVTLLRRKPGMTLEAFLEYYETTHARIGEKYLSGHATRYQRRYLHPVPGREARQSRLYDVVMEIWFPDREALDSALRALQTAQAQAEISADEQQLFDRDYIDSHVVEEHESCLQPP